MVLGESERKKKKKKNGTIFFCHPNTTLTTSREKKKLQNFSPFFFQRKKKKKKNEQAWIRSIGIDGKDLANLLAHHPTIFHNPLHVAKENVKLLKSSGGEVAKGVKDFPALKLSDAQAAKVMLGAPVLFRRPLTGKSMRSKLRYWSSSEAEEGGLGKSFAELADAPRFLERSLRSSAPRLEFAKKVSSGSLPHNLAPLLEGPEGAFAEERLGAPGEQATFEEFRLEWSRKSAGKWGLN